MESVIIDGFELDVAISEGHRLASSVTDYPVESGATITDHVRQEPIVVTIEGVVTNTPSLGIVGRRRSAVFEVSATEGQVTANGVRLETLPSDDAFAHLRRIYDRREPVTIVTARRTYESMALESLSVDDDEKTGDALWFTAVFKEVRVVANLRTTVPVAEPRAAKHQKLGSKPSPVMTSEKELPATQPVVDTTRPPVRVVRGAPDPLPGRVVLADTNNLPPNRSPVDLFGGSGFANRGGF